MPKILPVSKPQEWLGLDKIAPTVHSMKCVYRELTKDDFGIDGEIEVVIPLPDGSGYQVTSGVIKFQSKSGKKYVTQDTQTSFSSPVEKKDLEYWYSANFPTIYIVYHPGEDKLYWKEVRSYVKNNPNIFQPPLKIVFNKATDEFTSNCYESLCGLARISPPRISMTEQERLFSNLLRVEHLPWMWCAPTNIKNKSEVWQTVQGTVSPFVIVDGMLYSFSDLTRQSSKLVPFCDNTDAHRFYHPEDWWKDDDLKRKYVCMLNRLLGRQLRRCKIRYNRHFKRNYFPRENDKLLEFEHDWYNVRTTHRVPGRLTTKFYTYGYNTFWRHTAANMNFKLIGLTWYLQIIPKYFFTEDGIMPCESSKVGPYLRTDNASFP